MDETLIWCALIGAVAYVTRAAFPSYYELTRGRAKHRLDAINDAVDDMEQEMAGILQRIEELEKLDETVTHNCLRLAVLENAALDARAGSPANEARHD